jgi:BMFP domain-containing protein YqiC
MGHVWCRIWIWTAPCQIAYRVRMLDPKALDDLARRLAASVPQGVVSLQHDLEKNFRAVLQAALSRLDLVTREEFDAQRRTLERTRARVEALDRELTALEEQVLKREQEFPGERTT